MTTILWSTDPATQRAIWTVLAALAIALLTVHGPLVVRLVRLLLLERRLGEIEDRHESGSRSAGNDPIGDVLRASPLAEVYAEFERRWSTARLQESQDRAPIRLMDVFDDHPLLPHGPRRSLLPVLPGLFLGLGILAAIVGVIPGLGQLPTAPDADTTIWLVDALGLALRATAWGVVAALATSLLGRSIEGAFEARAVGLDAIVERAYGSISPGELAELTRQTQQRSLETLGKELSQFANELNERLDRGLQRIEQSTSRAASLVSQEQRGALHTVVQELSLSVRQGVEHHLAELRGALQRAVEHQGTVTSGLSETFQRMVENAETQDRVARTLVDSSTSVEEAARSLRGAAAEMQPVLDHLGGTSRALSDTAERMGTTQDLVARSAEGVRSALEHAAGGVDEQRLFMERSLVEIRQALDGLGDGLGTSLQRSLREVDNVLGSTVGQLRETLAESNDTIERLAVPIRAAEGSTREIHVALDRVRDEVEGLGQWMSQAVKPLRSGLGDVETRAEDIARAITEFTAHTRQIDKSMQALRNEIHEESRRLQSSGSELGRRLGQATDAVALIDARATDASRRRSDPPRERAWSRSPAPPPGRRGADRPEDELAAGAGLRAESGENDEGPAEASAGPAARDDDPGAAATSVSREADPPAAAREASDPQSDPDPATPRDATRSGFRLGEPRALGPDPYDRLEREAAGPSNVRHFPTRERELGDGLKLSGLLGPSEPTSASRTTGQDQAEDEPRRGARDRDGED